jgi:hypothetical protein
LLGGALSDFPVQLLARIELLEAFRVRTEAHGLLVTEPEDAERHQALVEEAMDAVLPLEEIGKFVYGLCVVPAGVREKTGA